MLPAAAFWMVATACTRTPPSPRTLPPQRDANSASVYPAPMRPSVAALGVLGLVVLLHLRQHLIGDVHSVVCIEHALAADDHVLFLSQGEFLHGFEDVLLQLAQLGIALHVVVVLEIARLAAEVALQLIELEIGRAH